MDDLVVIIITILIAVVGVLNQRNKKKHAQQATSDAPKQPADFWEMIMQEQQAQEPVFTRPPIHEVFDDEPEESVTQPTPEYRFNAQSEGASEIKPAVRMERIPQKKAVLIDGEKFSIRKAVIYNEILNRKYS